MESDKPTAFEMLNLKRRLEMYAEDHPLTGRYCFIPEESESDQEIETSTWISNFANDSAFSP